MSFFANGNLAVNNALLRYAHPYRKENDPEDFDSEMSVF